MSNDDVLRLGRGDDLQMFRTPDAWPHPYLPLTRGGSGPAAQLGIVVARADVSRSRVFLVNMFDGRLRKLIRRGDQGDMPYEDYPTIEKMIEAGWHVD